MSSMSLIFDRSDDGIILTVKIIKEFILIALISKVMEVALYLQLESLYKNAMGTEMHPYENKMANQVHIGSEIKKIEAHTGRKSCP